LGNFTFCFIGVALNLLSAFLLPVVVWGRHSKSKSRPVYDVAIAGTSKSGWAAAISASRSGSSVVLLCFDDVPFEALGTCLDSAYPASLPFAAGIGAEWSRALLQTNDSESGDHAKTCYQAKAGKHVLKRALKSTLGIVLVRCLPPDSLEGGYRENRNKFTSIQFRKRNKAIWIDARVWIDATPDGSILKTAGCTPFSPKIFDSDFEEADSLRLKTRTLATRQSMRGTYLFSALDALPEDGLKRTPVSEASIGVGYNLIHPALPFTIPFGVMVPVGARNILSTQVLSATEIGSELLALDVAQLTIGQAAGIAASLAARRRWSVSGIPTDSVQQRLLQQKIPLVALDLPYDAQYFEALQKIGLMGWFTRNGMFLAGPYSEKDVDWLCHKTGFSASEISPILKGEHPEKEMIFLYNTWLEAGKKP